MHFNKVELCTLACHPSHDFNKEGVLLFLEKQDSFFRRNDKAFVERFCRLRGNLLFYFKSRDYCSEPIGVLVLENFQIIDENTPDNPHSFTIVYEDNSQSLSAVNAKEKASWIGLIQRASLSYMKSQIENLVHLISICHPSLPVNINKYRMDIGATIDLCKPPFLEMSVSCDNLRCNSNGVPPNPRVSIYISKPPHKTWILYSQTEVMERTSNPAFLSTVTFRHCDGVDGETKLCFIINDVRERMSDTYLHLGKTMITVQSLMEAGRLRLFLLSPEKNTIGFITLNTWLISSDSKDLKSKFVNATPKHFPISNCERPVGHRRTQSLPPKLNCKIKQPSQGNLNLMYENPIVSTFRFHSGLGGDISVMEIMAESFLCFHFPQQLLRLWISEEEQQCEEVNSLGDLSEEWKSRQLSLLNQHSTLISVYGIALSTLEMNANAGVYFRSSLEKEENSLEFSPINLHLQRMFAQNESLRRSKFYDVFTVGAFSANSLGYKKGGLLDMLEQSKTIESRSGNKTALCEETINSLRRLRKEIILLLRLLLLSLKNKEAESLLSVLQKLQEKTSLLLHVLDPSLVDEAFEFLDQIRVPKNPPHTLTLASRTPLIDPINGYTSPEQALDLELASPVIHDVFSNTDNSQKLLNDFSCEKNNSYRTRLEEGLSEFCMNSCYKSTDEPEPWDLIQLNIRASLICLSSKIKSYSQSYLSENKVSCTDSHVPDARQSKVTVPYIKEETSDASEQSVSRESKSFGKRSYLETSFDDDFESKSLIQESLEETNESSGPCTPDVSPCDDSGIVVDREKMEETLLVNSRNFASSTVKRDAIDVCKNIEQKKDCLHQSQEKVVREDWLTEVRPSIRKLRQAIDGLMRTARLTHSVLRLRDSPERSYFNYTVKYRRDICFSQALTSVVTSLLTKIWCRKMDSNFISILTKIGPLILFEGLLSCYRSESGRLSDMIVAVEDIASVDFIMVPAGVFSEGTVSTSGSPSQKKIPLPRVTGTRRALRVILPVPEQMLSLLPCGSKVHPSDPPSFRVTPVFFNVGINEEATLAAKLSKDGNQYRSNHDNFDRLSSYYNRYKSFFPVEEDTRRNTLSSPVIGRRKETLNTLFIQLHKEVFRHQSKNVTILQIASRICRAMDGLRFTSCKSAKDRTAMSVTLEEVNLLQEDFDLSQSEYKAALDCLRSTQGTRLKNCEKNVGRAKYAFSSIQLALFPPLYKPPSGTFGVNPT